MVEIILAVAGILLFSAWGYVVFEIACDAFADHTPPPSIYDDRPVYVGRSLNMARARRGFVA